MRRASAFLQAVGQALSAAGLYDRGHSAREEAAARVHDRIVQLLEASGPVAFSLFPDEVVVRGEPLPAMSEWPWAGRLVEAGVQRLEFAPTPSRDEMDRFLVELLDRLAESEEGENGEPRPLRLEHVQFGRLAVTREGRSAEREEASGDATLGKERELAERLFEEVADRDRVPLLETLTLVDSLAAVLAGVTPASDALASLEPGADHASLHGLRVALLSLRLAEEAGLPADRIRQIGSAGLLHDIGRREPDGGAARSEAEGEEHTRRGCRLLLESGPEAGVAAVVALEHHRRPDGGGFPSLHYGDAPCREARIVQVADRYDAVRHEPEAEEMLREAGEAGELDPKVVELLLSRVLEPSGRRSG